MSSPEIEKLLSAADETESVELKIFQNAVIKNLKNYQENPTRANKNNLDASRESLETKKQELEKKYFSELQGFTSLHEVVAHLTAAGFRISKSKLYRDKDKGMIRINSDGSVPETEVRAYAATLERKDGDIGDLNDVHARKTAREVESLEMKIAKQKFELEKEQGKYIPRADFEAELAARAAVLESGFRNLFNIKVREWIALAGGQMEKSADLLQVLNMALDEQLTQYAGLKTFYVMFEGE